MFLPGHAKGGESRDFRLTVFANADLSQLLPEIGKSVAIAEQPKNLIATCTERHIAWLSLGVTPEDGEVEALPDFLPETFPMPFGRTIAPDPILAMIKFVFRVAGEQAESLLGSLLMQASDQSQQAIRLLHGLATGEGYAF